MWCVCGLSVQAYGELTDYYLAFKRPVGFKPIVVWGTPTTYADVYSVFVQYVKGQVAQLPWCNERIKPVCARVCVRVSAFAFLCRCLSPHAHCVRRMKPRPSLCSRQCTSVFPLCSPPSAQQPTRDGFRWGSSPTRPRHTAASIASGRRAT